VRNQARRRGPLFEMTLRNVIWPFFERVGQCASCGERIGDAPDALLCIECTSGDASAAKREAGVVTSCEEIIELI
jgi:anaerobic ribonucleoside-triphosphate reductase